MRTTVLEVRHVKLLGLLLLEVDHEVLLLREYDSLLLLRCRGSGRGGLEGGG
jgi:hypothetical protein